MITGKMVALLTLWFLTSLLLNPVDGFQPQSIRNSPTSRSIASSYSSYSSGRITSQIFAQEGEEEAKSEEKQEGNEGGGNRFIPAFLNRFKRGSSNNDDTSAQPQELGLAATGSDSSSTIATSTVVATETKTPENGVPVPVSTAPKPRERVQLSASEQARNLKAQAEKTRLEAERLDAELTLQKIERLERELKHAKAKGTDSVEKLQKEMAALQAKLAGEPATPVVAPPKTTSSDITISLERSSKTTKSKPQEVPKGDFSSNLPSVVEPFDQKEFDSVLDDFSDSPNFLKRLICGQLGFEFPSDDSINNTAVALRLDEIRRCDFSFYEGERPSFTAEDIDKMKQRLKANWMTEEDSFVPDGRLKEAAGGNETELALLCLEYEFMSTMFEVNEDNASSFFEDEQVIAEISSAIQQLSFDSVTESSLPPCTRKEDAEQPTLAQAQTLVKDILPKAKFTSTSKPMSCPGGFIIKGTTKAKNGDELIEAIDAQLEKSSLRDKVTVCYLSDFTVFMDEVDNIDLDNIGGILFVGGPDIVREPRKVALSIATAIGITTCWYLSLYPFLLNPAIGKRVDEQLALVEANMPADLSWLTDLSFPLFVTFVGLQLLHEFGHRSVSVFNGVKPTFPTFVPSFITGVTSITNSFKEPPRNLQSMFDFSVAGPLLGMLGSIAAIFVGTQLSINADAANFPALPLEILRQSSLGGGIIENVMGSGILNIPDGARGTPAIAGMTIPLHPVAIAGYISLVVNALSMLPIGTTDGGRVALALFGRQTKQAIGGLALLTILILGTQGSDLFLFYFAFCLAFQKGNEIPCRNEVDTVDFSRVIVATAAYFIALLALIPFQ